VVGSSWYGSSKSSQERSFFLSYLEYRNDSDNENSPMQYGSILNQFLL
jgi:hypothetical protein